MHADQQIGPRRGGQVEPVGPVPPPTLTVVRPNPDFEKWVGWYAAIICAVSHGQEPSPDPALIDPCGQHRWEARQIAYARLGEAHYFDGKVQENLRIASEGERETEVHDGPGEDR
jgi:hypothetical protein